MNDVIMHKYLSIQIVIVCLKFLVGVGVSEDQNGKKLCAPIY